MRSISSALAVALGAPVQRPAILLEVGFSPVMRLSSGGTVSWGGQSWQAADIAVESLRVDPFRVTGTLVLGNTDGAAGALCIDQGTQDRYIRIWAYDASATGAPDVVWICDAQGSAARVDERDVRIALRHRAELIASPRTVVGPEAGFTHRIPAGAVLKINGIDYRLERDA